MKKLAILLMLLSLGVFSFGLVGCKPTAEPAATPPEVEEPAPEGEEVAPEEEPAPEEEAAPVEEEPAPEEETPPAE